MRKVLRVCNLDCAACAAKLERAIAKISGVSEASLNFIAEKLIIEVEDENYAKIAEDIKATAKKVEPECEIKGL